MGLVSALAVASARVWWLVAYWTPRAPAFRRRARALELGVDWQQARELPAADSWRQQLEREIGASAVAVPLTPELLSDAVERQSPGSRRWRRRQVRATARARFGAHGTAIEPRPPAVVGTRRRVLARVLPLVAAVSLGGIVGPVVHDAVLGPRTTVVPKNGVLFRYECSQCRQVGAHEVNRVPFDGQRIPVFADQGVAPAFRRAR